MVGFGIRYIIEQVDNGSYIRIKCNKVMILGLTRIHLGLTPGPLCHKDTNDMGIRFSASEVLSAHVDGPGHRRPLAKL